MPRSVSQFTYAGANRVPSPEEMLQIIQEQRRFIENLKGENFRLQQQIAEMENDRSTVAKVMGIAQKNAEDIIRKARQEAQEINESARLRAKKNLDAVDSYVEELLETEDSLEGLLGLLHRFRDQMLRIDEGRPQLEIGVQAQGEHTAV